MEKAKLHAKIALCILAVIAATFLAAPFVVFGKVQWLSVGILMASWWLSFIAIFVVMYNLRNVFGFVRRAVQLQRSLPRGASSNRLLMICVAVPATAWVVYQFGHYYVATIQYGTNFDGLTAFAITALLVSIAKINGYHRQDKKRAKKESRQTSTTQAKAQNAGLSIMDFEPAG